MYIVLDVATRLTWNGLN